MKLLRYILFPIVPFYYVITWFRNILYDFGVKKSKAYDFPVICVGNLSVGGTGKTPMIEYLIRWLQSDYRLATLSRGYKRESVGFKLADDSDSAKTIGDEPFQFYNKFKEKLMVAVDSDRQRGIENLRALNNKPEIILLDDAFQHRKVQAGLNILLTTYDNLYCDDWVLPTGDLREPRAGAKRAKIIMVTKCPETLSDVEKNKIVLKLQPQSHQTVFFSYIDYANQVISINNTRPVSDLNTFTLVTGIANPKPLVDFLKSQGLTFKHLNFKDHHVFSEQEITLFEKEACIVTTEKDYMRLKQYQSLEDKLCYLPIEAKISDDQQSGFNTLISHFVKR